MKFVACTDEEEMSQRAFQAVFTDIKEFQDQLICAATGNSVRGLYRKLVSQSQAEPRLFENLCLIKLDEWFGLAGDHPASCEYYLQKSLLVPLGIAGDRYIGFRNNPVDPARECQRIDNAIRSKGGIGCCILGIGVNGHLGFNEPGEILHPFCHLAQLTETSLGHKMIGGLEKKPEFGLTLGMRAIMQARKIVLLLTGTGKRPVIEALLEQKITTSLPASFLWNHPDVYCFRDMATTG